MNVRVIHDDCLAAMDQMAQDRLGIDAVVTDPPYHLASIVARLGSPDASPIQSGVTGVYARSSAGFMGQQWDGGDIAFQPETWRKVFRILKPGAHLVAFSATRTYHRMACAIEDAGFEIRDQLAWVYGTGFPKSHNLDGEYEGWGTALKPGWEPIVLARKPIIGSVPENMAMFGAGALNIDGCRVPIDSDERFDGGGQSRTGVNVTTHHEGWTRPWMRDPEAVAAHRDRLRDNVEHARALGRWPANLVHDGSDEVLEAIAAFGNKGAAAPVHRRNADKFRNTYGAFKGNIDEEGSTFRGDSGSASRFFYCAKATAEDRAGSEHPTVKPIALMCWLVRMICPPGGLVLDPFAGSGTTAAAALAEGSQALLIEREEQYVRDICRRLGRPVDEVLNAHVKARPVRQLESGPLFLDWKGA